MVFSLNGHIAVMKPQVPGLILTVVNLHSVVRRRGSPSCFRDSVGQVFLGLGGDAMSRDPE